MKPSETITSSSTQNDMDTNFEKLSPLTGQGVSITEAALRLGVSERTIYRMLREGKLQRIMSDNKGRNVRLSVAELRILLPHQTEDLPILSDNLSDKISENMLDVLRQELREKDAQIARLIEQQRETSEAMKRLQDQMYELARITLSQNMGNAGLIQNQTLPPVEAARKRRWWPWRKREASSS